MYAFGLFYENQSGTRRLGKYWCIISLEQVKMAELFNCTNMHFFNDESKQCYKFDLLIKI
jgi:hypothetical protein